MARLSLGLIIPSVNLMTEVQFKRYAPSDVEIYIDRFQMNDASGNRLGTEAVAKQVLESTETLANRGADVIVFQCTAASMAAGFEGDQDIVRSMETASGRLATSTASAVVAAFEGLDVKKIVLVSPYEQFDNDRERAYLEAAGVAVLHDHALALPSNEWNSLPGSFWEDAGAREDDPEADAIFLSCTNIRAIEAVETLRERIHRPVVSSNQAGLWHSLRLGGIDEDLAGLGALTSLQIPDTSTTINDLSARGTGSA